MPRTWRRTTLITRSVTRASRIGAETYTATLRRLAWSLAVQFMKAEASAHTTMSARSTLAGRPLRARPSASTEKMIMATSRARAWIMDATFWCLTEKMNRSCAANTT